MIVGRVLVHVNSHLESGSHTASSDVFKKTIIVSASPPTLFRSVSILHLISVAEVSYT